MRAYRIHHHGGPEVLELVELPRPALLPDEVLVRVRACALNHLDLWLRNGVEGHRFPLPLTPGSEVAGEVEEVGEAVGRSLPGIAPGAPVLVAPGLSCGICESCAAGRDTLCAHYGILGEHRDGGYAELLAVPRRNVLPLPSPLSFVEAASVPLVFLTAWRMLTERAQLRPLEDILIHAAGSGVSSAGIQIARLLGARRIIATAAGEAKLARARELGATDTLDYRESGWARRVREITGGKGVEVVLDHVGGEIFEESFKALGRAGRIVLCGASAEHQVTVNLRAVFYKSLSILGSTMGSLAELHELLRYFEAGRLRAVVDRTFPFEQAPAAQAVLESREQFGKVVLTVGDPEVATSRPS